MVCNLIDNDIYYHRDQNLLQTHVAQQGESAKTFEQCDDEHCIETILNPCQSFFYHNNDVKQNDSFSDKGIA